MEYEYEVSGTATAQLSSELSYRFEQGCANVPKMQKPPQNSRCQMGDMKQVRHWRPKNIGCHYAEFNRSGELMSGIFSPLGWYDKFADKDIKTEVYISPRCSEIR